MEEVMGIAEALHRSAVKQEVNIESENNLIQVLERIIAFTDMDEMTEFCNLVIDLFRKSHEED
jgi:hypothetical protein